MTTDGKYAYFGSSYVNHCPLYTYRAGDGGVYAVSIKDLFTRSWRWFGGVPLKIFEKKLLRIYTSKEVKIRIAEYSMLGTVIEDELKTIMT